ncbi:MAG TPA: hypothetical protein VNO22_14605 [Planctomycetota bacterium]|nr:hypothetical protein [Planctomycetota bacterium]
MIGLLGVFLAAAASDPRVERVERLAGEARRTTVWAPLAVTLSSAAGFEGDLVARSSFGFFTARRVRVAPGGRERVLLPAVDPVEIRAGAIGAAPPEASARPDLVVGVDVRLPFARELTSGERVRFVRFDPSDPFARELLRRGLLEAWDLLLLADAADLPLGAGPEAYVPSSREDAERRIQARAALPPPARFEAVDRELWNVLAPREGWVPAKRTFALFFAGAYAVAAFAALPFMAWARPRWMLPSAVALAGLFAIVYLVFFPKGQLWVLEHRCEVAPAGEGEAAEWRVWFAGAPVARRTRVEFPRWVKPVLPHPGAVDRPFTIRFSDAGSSAVEDLELAGGVPVAFAGAESRPPSFRAVERLPRPLYGASILRGNRNRRLGDLPAGTEVNALAVRDDEPAPGEADFRAFRRFIRGDALFGRLDREDAGAGEVSSADLAEARRRPRFFIQRLP